jgi:diadenosine tetraphosphatase ApaH/serine/threonine PP2A family protein phosphatase
MNLTFTDKNGNTEVLATSYDVVLLKEKASEHYTGEELLIWQSGPVGKPFSEHAPEIPCSFNVEDGSSYTIS